MNDKYTGGIISYNMIHIFLELNTLAVSKFRISSSWFRLERQTKIVKLESHCSGSGFKNDTERYFSCTLTFLEFYDGSIQLSVMVKSCFDKPKP